ncbi:hemolysin C [mine drainage metagenome]|uniref:Hemolysin C n=1 Tax=mine drainage metagenome TaxID=410659 RepID=A0A1J5R0P8_9ZZZZ
MLARKLLAIASRVSTTLDDIPLSALFAALFALLASAAFFSAAETGLMAVNRYRLRHLANEGHRGARLASALLAKTDKLLGVILLGSTFSVSATTTLATIIAVRMFGQGEWVLTLSTLSIAFSILVFSEIAPKVVAAAYPERVALTASYVLIFLLRIAQPLTWFVNLFVRAFLALLRLKPSFSENVHAVTMEELRTIVTEAGGYIPKKHQSILLNLFELEKITVDDVMTAHTQIEAVDFDDLPETILQQIATSHHTRLVVREGVAEEVIGMLHIRKVLHQARHGELTRDMLREVMTEPYYVPSGTPLYTQLQQFQEKQQRLALVVDEYGEVKGLLSLEDILEEIVGDFTTQSPARGTGYHEQEDGSWLVDGATPLRELNRKLGLTLPLDGPKTLNGLVLEHFQDIPEPGTSFRIGSHTLEVVQTHERIVKIVRIYP